MRKIFTYILMIFVVSILGLIGYGVKGWYDAVSDAPLSAKRADRIIAEGRGPDSLTTKRLQILLKVQDPGFYTHSGIDFSTPGAGMTTLTQSVSKRLAFDKFAPGVGKIRQTGYALGLDSGLSKEQQIALFLETAEMGPSDQGWVTGFHKASKVFFGKLPHELTDDDYYMLVAALIAPSKLSLAKQGEELKIRAKRIALLVEGKCKPNSWWDVWLEGCK